MMNRYRMDSALSLSSGSLNYLLQTNGQMDRQTYIVPPDLCTVVHTSVVWPVDRGVGRQTCRQTDWWIDRLTYTVPPDLCTVVHTSVVCPVDRQTDRQTDLHCSSRSLYCCSYVSSLACSQRGRWTDMQTDRLMDRQTDLHCSSRSLYCCSYVRSLASSFSFSSSSLLFSVSSVSEFDSSRFVFSSAIWIDYLSLDKMCLWKNYTPLKRLSNDLWNFLRTKIDITTHVSLNLEPLK